MKVERYMLYKLRCDLLNRKDTNLVYFQGTIDLNKAQKKNVLTFLDFKPNVLNFLKK